MVLRDDVEDDQAEFYAGNSQGSVREISSDEEIESPERNSITATANQSTINSVEEHKFSMKER